MTIVVDRFLDTCKKKIEDVQAEYNLMDCQHLDLEEEVSADSIFSMLSMEENDPKRIEREVVYPWIRFYWDNLRGILDLIKTNNTMEDLYHSVCKRAFDFCKTARKPYDVAVCLALLCFKKNFGNDFSYSNMKKME